jgi:hypothetical protein
MKHHKITDYILPAILFIFVTSMFLYTMPPTVYWQDAGIYIAGIKVEGNVYPPGYPLYLITLQLWVHIIPFGNFAQKIHSFSAIMGGILSVIVYLIALKQLNKNIVLFKNIQALREDLNIHNINGAERQVETISKSESILKRSIAILVSFVVSLNYNLWAQSINAEVYTLHALMLTIIIYLVYKLGENGRIDKNNTSNTIKYLIPIGVMYGLTFANHPMTILLVPVFLYILFLQKNILFHTRILFMACVLFIVSGLSWYAYLPIITGTHPYLNWGQPDTPERFLTHITGKTYVTNEQSFVFNDLTRYQAALQEFIWEFSWTGLLVALIGAILLWKKDKHATNILLIIFVMHIIFAVFYKQTTEYNSWLIPSHIILGFFIGYTIFSTITALTRLKKIDALKRVLTVFSVILIVCYILFQTFHWLENFKELNRKEYYYAEDFGKNILRNMDQNSLVIMTGDQESSTTMYAQTVLKYRTDLILFKNIESNQLTYPEGREDLRIRYNSLSIPEDTFNNPPEDVDENWYLNKLVESNFDSHSIYLMSRNIMQIDQTKYALQPAAVMWKVIKGCYDNNECQISDIDVKYWNFSYHDPKFYQKVERPLMSLKDASKPGGINRVPFLKHMINFELQAWKNLGDWYIAKGECYAAENAYNKMTIVDPNIFKELPQIPESIKACKQV